MAKRAEYVKRARRRRAENADVERCLECRWLFRAGEMVLWGDVRRCATCTAAVVWRERHGDPAELENELRGVRAAADRAALEAWRQEHGETRWWEQDQDGQSVVRGEGTN